MLTTAVFGGQLLAVEGNYDDVNRLCAELASEYPDWAFVNVNVRPYYAEGSKTLAFEVAEQLGWQLPDHVVVPIASGSQLTKIDKGFRELVELGLVAPRLDPEDPAGPVRVSGAQAEGCSPVAKAFASGADSVRPVKPDTIAKSLAIGNPADGWYALEVVRRTGGAIGSVTDEEVLDGIRLLARTEGIFAETAGGVTISTLAKLARRRCRARRRAGRRLRDRERSEDGRGLRELDLPDSHDPPSSRGRSGSARRAALVRIDEGAQVVSVTVRVPAQLRTLTGGVGERRGPRRHRAGADRLGRGAAPGNRGAVVG